MRQLAAYLLVFAGVCWPTTDDRGRVELSVFLHDVLLLDIFHFCKKNVYIACRIEFKGSDRHNLTVGSRNEIAVGKRV